MATASLRQEGGGASKIAGLLEPEKSQGNRARAGKPWDFFVFQVVPDSVN
jgi:hypothetical protein